MNGDIRAEGSCIVTLSLESGSDVQFTVMLTSVSTDGGRVTLQVRVWEVPSYTGSLGTLMSTVGTGTARAEDYVSSFHT